MNDREILWPGGPVLRQAAHFRLGTDCVLLADFVNTAGARRGVDLGCASGAVMLLLLERSPALHMLGLEIVPEAAALARENMAANGFAVRSGILAADVRNCRALLRAGSFDLAVCNPPYFTRGSGASAADADRAAARTETCGALADFCAAAGWLLRTGGRAFFVHRPERLAELFACMTAAGLEPKRLRLVCKNTAAAPSLVLAEGRRGGRPGLSVEPALFLQDPDGSESAELRRIYHRDG